MIYYIGEFVVCLMFFLNDFVVDCDNEVIYIFDIGDGQSFVFIVLDFDIGCVCCVFEGFQFIILEDMLMIIDGWEIFLGGNLVKIGVNLIIVDFMNIWVYFVFMIVMFMYWVKIVDLLNEDLFEVDFRVWVECYGVKFIFDGLIIDMGGNVYIIVMIDNVIGVIKFDGIYEVFY